MSAVQSEKLAGMGETLRYFDQLPVEARHELQDTIGRAARGVLLEQQTVVAKKTGALAARLTLALIAEKLAARIGLVGVGAGRRTKYDAASFYGRFVHFGRAAQTVVVTRRVKGRKVRGNGRVRADGTKSQRTVSYLNQKEKLRRKRTYDGKPSLNTGTPVGSPYKLQVAAMGARPFIDPPGARDAADAEIGGFWDRLDARIGGGGAGA